MNPAAYKTPYYFRNLVGLILMRRLRGISRCWSKSPCISDIQKGCSKFRRGVLNIYYRLICSLCSTNALTVGASPAELFHTFACVPTRDSGFAFILCLSTFARFIWLLFVAKAQNTVCFSGLSCVFNDIYELREFAFRLPSRSHFGFHPPPHEYSSSAFKNTFPFASIHRLYLGNIFQSDFGLYGSFAARFFSLHCRSFGVCLLLSSR